MLELGQRAYKFHRQESSSDTQQRLQFTKETSKCTNNITEYKAILLRLRKLRATGSRDA
jgi:ribonuclease HI